MKINISPNLDQIRFIAKSALHAWDYQDLEAGRDQVIADMEELLAYLDALNYGEGVVVASIAPVKAGVRLECSTREGDFFDLTDRYNGQNVELDIDGNDRGNACSGMGEHGMRAKRAAPTEGSQDDLRTVIDRSAK